MTHSTTRARSVVLAAVAALLLLFPVTVAAHADLDVPTPADGATVEGTPAEIFGTFTQAMAPDGSSLVLRDPANAVVARGGVDPDDDHRMVITDVPELAPGDYLVQWTTISAEDDELDRDTWTFTVTEAATPPPTSTPEPSAVPSTSPSATPEPSHEVSTTPSGSAVPQDPTASSADVVLPIILGLAIVLIAAGYLVSRRGRPPGRA
jgi:methionine-rich copper-binding protein CopC